MEPDFEDLLDHLVDHLCAEQAEAVAELPDAEIRRRATLALRRAQAHGFTEPRAATAFATLMFVVAPDFDQHPKIAAALKGTATDDVRLRQLFERTSETDWDEAERQSQGWASLA
jgi:hypothetical protein